MSKACNTCNQKLLLSDFHVDSRAKDGRRASCKGCRTAWTRADYKKHKDIYQKRQRKCLLDPERYKTSIDYMRNWRQVNKDRIAIMKKEKYKRYKEQGLSIRGWIMAEYDGTPCLDCDGVFDWCAMDFDHRPDSIKEFTISKWGTRIACPDNLIKVIEEIAKCEIVCSNCHRVRTQKVFDAR